MLGLGALLYSTAALGQVEAPHARPLSQADRRALLSGDRVERALAFETGSGRYVGGVAYQLVNAPPEVVLRALEDVERLPEILPRTREARLLETTPNGLRLVLTQGAGPFVASYGIELVRAPEQGEIRFWLDPSVPRDIRDVWGFFRAVPHEGGRTLVTLAVAVDLGPGLVRALFESRIQSLLLRSVSRIGGVVAPTELAGGGAVLR